jgi:hypothetical protein
VQQYESNRQIDVADPILGVQITTKDDHLSDAVKPGIITVHAPGSCQKLFYASTRIPARNRGRGACNPQRVAGHRIASSNALLKWRHFDVTQHSEGVNQAARLVFRSLEPTPRIFDRPEILTEAAKERSHLECRTTGSFPRTSISRCLFCSFPGDNPERGRKHSRRWPPGRS